MTFEIIFEQGTPTAEIYRILQEIESLGYVFLVDWVTHIKGEKTNKSKK